MPLQDYVHGFSALKNRLNVVICIYQKPGQCLRSPVNRFLEYVQNALKKEFDNYREIQIAYVYENPSTLGVKPFERLITNTPIYYKEPYEKYKPHDISHVVQMGLALLRQKCAEDGKEEKNRENRLILISDDYFEDSQTKKIFYEKEDTICLNPCFSDLSVDFYLYLANQSEEAEKMGRLEKFFSRKNKIIWISDIE